MYCLQKNWVINIYLELITYMTTTGLTMLSTGRIRKVEIDGTKESLICGKAGDVDRTYKKSRGGIR